MPQKDFARALRRHHVQRLKANRKTYYGYGRSGDRNAEMPARFLGMTVHTAKVCSCPMCGNARKFFGNETIQELKAKQESVDRLLAEASESNE